MLFQDFFQPKFIRLQSFFVGISHHKAWRPVLGLKTWKRSWRYWTKKFNKKPLAERIVNCWWNSEKESYQINLQLYWLPAAAPSLCGFLTSWLGKQMRCFPYECPQKSAKRIMYTHHHQSSSSSAVKMISTYHNHHLLMICPLSTKIITPKTHDKYWEIIFHNYPSSIFRHAQSISSGHHILFAQRTVIGNATARDVAGALSTRKMPAPWSVPWVSCHNSKLV